MNPSNRKTKTAPEIRIRDPFVVAHEDTYYMYGTIGETAGERSLYAMESADLIHWGEPVKIFTLPEDSWGEKELWAPEVHLYRGKFYLLVSVLGSHGKRGVQVAVSDHPLGDFRCIVNRPATPMDKSCIDGTLYVENGVPYMVFSHDWPDNYLPAQDVYVGQICAVQLTEDLTAPVGGDWVLFDSWDAPLSKDRPVRNTLPGKGRVLRYGTDGPFLEKLPDGRLLMLWSPIPQGNYIVASAVSESGSIRGPWTHHEEAVFDKNGGHAMLFRDFAGQLKICMHHPERYFHEHPMILDAEIRDGRVRITDERALVHMNTN